MANVAHAPRAVHGDPPVIFPACIVALYPPDQLAGDRPAPTTPDQLAGDDGPRRPAGQEGGAR